jgi:hypothetical protein
LVCYLPGILKPGLDGDSLQKCRALNFLHSWLTDYECGYQLSDFGFSRHSEKTDHTNSSVFVLSQQREIVGEIKIRLTASPKVLPRRVAILMNCEPVPFVLEYQDQKLLDYKTLQ